MEEEGEIPSRVGNEVSDLEHFCTEIIHLWTYCADVVRPFGILLSTATLILALYLFLWHQSEDIFLLASRELEAL